MTPRPAAALAAVGGLLLLSGSLWAGSCGQPPAFTLTPQFGANSTVAIAWADFDNDGDLDLAVANSGATAPTELYINNGGGSFTQQLPFGTGNSFAALWVDLDNDGDEDFIVGRFGTNMLFINNGAGGFTSQARFGTGRTVALAAADFDLDGDVDIAVGRGLLGLNQQNFLYVNNGDGTYTQRLEFGIGQTATLAWGDYDNDGDPDLAVGHGGFGFTGQNSLYVNNGDGTFTGHDEFGQGDTTSMAWADSDLDGDLDLAVMNWNDGQSYLYLNNGDGSFTAQPIFGIGDPNACNWGDYDNDGDMDLAQGNGDFTSAGVNRLYINDGTGGFSASRQFGVSSTDSVAFADYDRDGDLDLANGNEHSPPQNTLAINNGVAGESISLRLRGRSAQLGPGFSNRDAIGAVVRAYDLGHVGEAAHLVAHQRVSATGGFTSQQPLELTLGICDRPAVDVRIDWPGSAGSHITQYVLHVLAGARLTIDETAPNPADLNHDGVVSGLDLAMLLAAWGPCPPPGVSPCPADLNGSGLVNGLDLAMLLGAWG